MSIERPIVHDTEHLASFRAILGGKKAFYSQPDYKAKSKAEFAQKECLPVSYCHNTESTIVRVAKLIFSILIFPVGIHHLLHSLAGKMGIVPASNPSLMGYTSSHPEESRRRISLNGVWKYKRLTVEVDGYKIDAMIVGKASTLRNGRWLVESLGNGEFYEETLSESSELYGLLGRLKSNGIVFNYPGVGASSGLPNRWAMAKAYRAILSFLEDAQKGVGAKEIIGFGHSIGGGVQSDALQDHELKKGIKYVFVKSRTFSTLSQMASHIVPKPWNWLATLLGWNIDSVKVSQKIKVPEIILQTASVQTQEELTDSSKLRDDGVIPAKASLAKALLDSPTNRKAKKVFIGIQEGHNDALRDSTLLARKIEQFLSD